MAESCQAPGGPDSSLFGRHPLGSADRRGVAISARRVCCAFDLLAAIAAVARVRRLVEWMAYLLAHRHESIARE
jgi:hypothetical protein